MADFPWIHLGIGIFGNVTFIVGSVFFLFPGLQAAGIWLFIFGTFGMLLGSLGEVLVRYERHVQGRRGALPRR